MDLTAGHSWSAWDRLYLVPCSVHGGVNNCSPRPLASQGCFDGSVPGDRLSTPPPPPPTNLPASTFRSDPRHFQRASFETSSGSSARICFSMASSAKIFSLEGRALKLTTAEDLEPHIAELRANDVEEVRLLGNSLGVGACKLLGEVLATKKNLKVGSCSTRPLGFLYESADGPGRRLQTSPTSSQGACSARSPMPSPLSSRPF